MNRKFERWIWIGTTATLLIVLGAFIFAPGVLARSRMSRQLSTDEYLESFNGAFNLILEYYVEDVDPEVLYKGAMTGLFESLGDPYTMFIPADDSFAQDISDTTSGEFGGVGLYISKEPFDEENPFGRMDYVEVVSPIEGTPAYREGIQAGDMVFEIDGESAEGFSVEEVSNRLRGIAGTDVEVTFLRGRDITYTVTITRAVIEIPTVKYDIINGHIGYLRIIQFTPHTPERTKEALEYFLSENVDDLIIDVRGNPGGLLDSVLTIGDYFLRGDIIVSTKSRIEEANHVYTARRTRIFPGDIPIVILIDKGSASASEILTGALMDNGRATVIGTTSYGKASVQQVLSIDDINTVKMTTAKYLTPNGTDINHKGIEPDILVEEPEASEEELETYRVLIMENRIGQFITDHPIPSDSEQTQFINDLRAEGLEVNDRRIRMWIKREYERRMDDPPVYDMEYDNVLIKAVNFLED